jgi:hypothetical protein
MGDLAAGVAKLTTEVAALTKKVAYLEQAPKVSRVQKCHKYARFLKNASAGEANAIFWSLVAFGIVLLMIASLLWSSQDKHHRYIPLPRVPLLNMLILAKRNFENAIKNQETQQNLQALEAKKTKSHERVVLASILCFLTAVPCIIIEAFAGMAITFCHKEDVPFLYWGVFFLLSVGSLIAVMGLSFGIMCSSRRPPWNLSLGTPVLVIAGLGHLGFYGMRDQVRKLQGKEPKHNSREPYVLSQDGVHIELNLL